MLCPVCEYPNPPGADCCQNCQTPLAGLDAPQPYGPVEASLLNDPVSVLGPRPPVTLPLDATLDDALGRMTAEGVGAVLITDVAGYLVGILTERDVLTKAAGRPDYRHLPVADLMTRSPETVAPTDPLVVALGKMDGGGYRHLPVVAGGRPVGVVSVRDVLRHLTALTADGG